MAMPGGPGTAMSEGVSHGDRSSVITPNARAPEDQVAAARARAAGARARAARALDEARGALERGDANAQAAALADMRAAVDELEESMSLIAGANAQPTNGTAPLRWFHAHTGAPHDADDGLTVVHWISMASLAGLVALGGIGTLRRRRRAHKILAELAKVPAAPADVLPDRGWSGTLRLAQIIGETSGIKTFRFVAADGMMPFRFRAGQYVRVSAEIDGKPTTRAYSISSEPGQRSHIDLTIKREPGGKMSGYFHERLAIGALVRIEGPAGQFVFDESRDRILLIGGGVGMTPLMSVVRDLIARGWPGQILVVSSIARSEERLFGPELDLLAARHPHLRVVTVVAPPNDPSTWIDRAFLERTVPEVFRWRAHICGPASMMTAMSGYLRELGVPPDQVWTEAFTAVRSAPAEGEGTSHEVRFATSATSVAVRGTATVLDAADVAKVSIDSSCRVGVCGACKVRLLKGRVTMAVDESLTDVDRANGVVLACQAVPVTDVEVGA
jgi:ferredoxin-NADP reductase